MLITIDSIIISLIIFIDFIIWQVCLFEGGGGGAEVLAIMVSAPRDARLLEELGIGSLAILVPDSGPSLSASFVASFPGEPAPFP